MVKYWELYALGNRRKILLPLTYKPQPFQLSGMFRSGGEQVDAGGIDGTVAQHIGQLYNIPGNPVEGGGKQVPQIMGEYLARFHPGPGAQRLHDPPDLKAGQRTPVFGAKNSAGDDFLLFGVFHQLAAQPAGEQNGAQLALEGDIRLSPLSGFHSYVFHLTHPDARGANGFQQQGGDVFSLCLCCSYQFLIVLPCQVPGGLPEHLPLDLQELGPAILPAQEMKQTVEGRELNIDRSRSIALF